MSKGARLRIIAGAVGGRFIQAPPGRTTRPTPERVREAWFSAIGDRIVDARVADLFAGSGALGIEALSRGAARVHFVESDPRAVQVIRSNLSSVDLASQGHVVRSDALAWVEKGVESLDVVLADPPYGSGAAERLIDRFRQQPFAEELWVEHEARNDLSAAADWTRRYGDTAISRFRSDPEAQTE